MHKGVILLVKEKNVKEVRSKVKEFMEEYGDGQVWDWYVIGGRWTNTLAPAQKLKAFNDKAEKILYPDGKKDFLSVKTCEENQAILQKEWEEAGLAGENYYASSYSVPDEGGVYDIVDLKECISIVSEWHQGIEACDKMMEEAKEWLEGSHSSTGKKDYNMYGYLLKIAGDLYQQRFCFETNVYNLETWNYTIPEDIENYKAVMIDMHN